MHPVLFEIPGLGFPIRSFGVLVAAGILLAVWLWGRFLAKYGDDPENDPVRGSQVGMWVVVGVLIGARLMYVGVESARYLRTETTPAMEQYLAADDRGAVARVLLLESSADLETARRVAVGYDFLHDPIQVLAIWQGGLVMFGGLLGGILLGVWACRRHGLDPWNSLDTGLIAGFFGLAVGRWGCLLVGDDYGKLVPERYQDLPFPITLRVPPLDWLQANPESLFDHELAGQVLWATQPWMSINATLIALIGWSVLKRRRFYGQVGGLMLVLYAVSRYTIELFRGDEIRGVWFGGALSTSQIVSVLGLVCGLVILLRRRRAPLPETATRARP